MEEIKSEQRLDQHLIPIITWLETDTFDENQWAKLPPKMVDRKTDFLLNPDGVLLINAPRKSDIFLENSEYNSGLKIVIPSSLRQRCLQLVHDHPCSGHGGLDVTLDRLCRSFFWFKCRKDVKTYVASRERCQNVSQYNETKWTVDAAVTSGWKV
uniref:RNA-directed DNA polymerase n=1 Tax=Strigamia maritima TaxID=126957 RepID=T1JHK4_STRMM